MVCSFLFFFFFFLFCTTKNNLDYRGVEKRKEGTYNAEEIKADEWKKRFYRRFSCSIQRFR